MRDEDRTKEQLINELVELRRRTAELEKSEAERKRVEEALTQLIVFPKLNPNPVLKVDPKGHIQYLNPTAKRLFPGIQAAGLRHPFLACLKSAAARFQNEGETSHTCEVKVGDTWYEHSYSYVAESQSVCIYAFDITERKRAEEALRKNEERFRLLVESARYTIYRYRFAPARGFEYVSPAVTAITGYTPEEYYADPYLDFKIIHPDDRQLFEAIKFSHASHNPLILRWIRKDGTLIWVEQHNMPVYDEAGNPVAIESIARDITRRQLTEEKIQEQATLLDKARDAIGVRDLEHRLIYWNKGAQCLYGWTAEEVMGKYADELLYKEESLRPNGAKKNVTEKGEWIGELNQVTKDGKDIIVESRWTLVCDRDGKPKSILIINTDITEKKKLESQLLRAQRVESIGALAGGIAHDLNNILTPIMMASQILHEKFTDKQSRKLLNIIEKSTQRGANLIKQVMSFTRGAESEHTALKVTHLIYELKKIVEETFPKSIESRIDVPKNLWLIYGNATRLHQVLMNLCVNSRDAMPYGGILSISAENVFIGEHDAQVNIDAKAGPYIAITVSDTGTGIPSEMLPRIFEPFFTTKELGKGTGIGLSTALAIVKSHNGFINVYSEVGAGTTFKIYLPAIKTSEAQNAEEQQRDLPSGHGELILVVDDEAQIRQSTKVMLETYGYRVITASDGVEATALYAQNIEEIKIVLMDMMMPNMDGPASIRELRKIKPDIKIIAISGLTEEYKLAKAAITHIQAFLIKPYTAEKLLKTLHEVITRTPRTNAD